MTGGILQQASLCPWEAGIVDILAVWRRGTREISGTNCNPTGLLFKVAMLFVEAQQGSEVLDNGLILGLVLEVVVRATV